MITALDKNGQIVAAKADLRTDGHTCRVCGGDVVACGYTGGIKSPHFRHKVVECTDTWAKDKESNGMSAWHRNWQERFNLEHREVTIKKDGMLHRADIAVPIINTETQYVVEFQHSYLSAKKIKERESFYIDMAWVIDVNSEYFVVFNHSMFSKPLFTDNGKGYLKYRWESRGVKFDFKIEYSVFIGLVTIGDLMHYVNERVMGMEMEYYKKEEEERKRKAEYEMEERKRNEYLRAMRLSDLQSRESKEYANFRYTNNSKNIEIAEAILQYNPVPFIGSSINVFGDYIVDIRRYEEKGYIAIEEFSDLKHPMLSWFNSTKAVAVAFICPDLGELILLRFDTGFKEWYIRNKEHYQLVFKVVSGRHSKKMTMGQRIIPFRHVLNWVSLHRFVANHIPKNEQASLFNVY